MQLLCTSRSLSVVRLHISSSPARFSSVVLSHVISQVSVAHLKLVLNLFLNQLLTSVCLSLCVDYATDHSFSADVPIYTRSNNTFLLLNILNNFFQKLLPSKVKKTCVLPFNHVLKTYSISFYIVSNGKAHKIQTLGISFLFLTPLFLAL